MDKILWLRVEWKGSFEVVRSNLAKSSYTESDGSGFILEQVRERLISGRFVEKRVFDYETLDPFNNTVRFQNTRYDYVHFRISTESVGLEIWNPPRSIRTFLSTLAEFSGFRIAVSNLKINILSWMRNIESSLGRIELESLVCDEIMFSSSSRGRLWLAGSGDLLKTVERFGAVRVREVAFRYFHPAKGTGKSLLNDSGFCKISGTRDSTAIADIFEQAIPL